MDTDLLRKEAKKIKSFIQIGSCIEYGFIKSPQKENMESKIENLKSTYGKAKFLATKYLIQKYKDYKTNNNDMKGFD